MSVRESSQTVDFLLSLSKEIISVRDKKTLLNVLQYKLKEAFIFNDLAIHLYTRETPEEMEFFSGGRNIRKGVRLMENELTTLIRNAEEPLIWDAGTLSIIGTPMRDKDGVMGELLLFTENKEAYTPALLSLLQIVTGHISAAIRIIQAEGEIIERERERGILLSLGNDMASVRYKKDLLRIIDQKIKKIFSIRSISINLVNEDGITHSNYLYTSDDEHELPVNSTELIADKYPINDGFFDKVLYAAGPTVIDVEKLVAAGNAPVFMKFILDAGIKETVTVSLHSDAKHLGVFTLFSEKKAMFHRRQLTLINVLASQFSVALGNIFANEKLEQRNKEKALLLSISNVIATVRNKEHLLETINPFLKELFPFCYDLIGSIGADGNKFNIVTVSPGTQASGEDFREEEAWQYSREYQPFQEAASSSTPLVCDLDILMREKHHPDFVRWVYEKGAREMVIAAIRSKDKVWGYFIFFTKEKNKPDHSQLSIIQSITTQLTTALYNLLSAEKVEKQLLEIRNYKEKLEIENMYLQEEIGTVYNYNEIVGNNAALQRIFHIMKQVSPSDSTVLILGETGTGKELIARAIHNNSSRKNKMIVKVNCATLPANLIESELFGHEKGSFTGATEQRIGKFELANNSTLFLDEIGELPIELQAKLLRVIQEKEIERIGGKKTIRLNVRIVAATNRNLFEEVQVGKFREDLYYRLNVFPLELPPLRDRKDDIPLLVNHFVKKYSRKTGKEIKQVTQKVMQQLREYQWPGNIREMEHLIERSVIMNPGPVIRDIILPAGLKKEGVSFALKDQQEVKTIDEMERDYILSILKKCNGRIYGERGAAALLKIPPTTLNSKIKKLGIKRVHD